MHDDAHHVAARFSALLRPDEVGPTLQQVVEAAVEILPAVRHASITLATDDGSVRTAVATDELVREVDEAQCRLEQGPCVVAARTGEHVVSGDLAADPRFPDYGPVAAARGLCAQAGVAVGVGGTAGALNLYATEVGAFDAPSAPWVVIAHQATLALTYAHEIENLRQALESRTVIGQATGRVMERYAVDEQRAFALLTRLSSTRNVKLRDLARGIVDGEDRLG